MQDVVVWVDGVPSNGQKQPYCPVESESWKNVRADVFNECDANVTVRCEKSTSGRHMCEWRDRAGMVLTPSNPNDISTQNYRNCIYFDTSTFYFLPKAAYKRIISCFTPDIQSVISSPLERVSMST